MRTSSISNFFAPGSTGPVTYEGRELWLSFRITVQPGDQLDLKFEQFQRQPRQGIHLGCDKRRQKLRINGYEASHFVLWSDTAPTQVSIEYLPRRAAGSIYLTNVWKIDGFESLDMSGVNAAAMAVRQSAPDEWVLACNDGYGLEDPTFEDLVVRVRRHGSAAS